MVTPVFRKEMPHMNVKGLKISDILNIDLDAFNKLNEKELRALTSRLVSAGNKRIRRLQEHEINSPAMQSLGNEKAFSTKLSKDTTTQQRVNKLRAEFSRARNFLNAETSTIGGYKKFKKKTINKIAKDLNMTEKVVEKSLDVNRLFDLLHKAQQQGLVSSYRGSKGSIQARNVIAEILIDKPDVKEDTLLYWLKNTQDELYESQEELEDETEEFEL